MNNKYKTLSFDSGLYTSEISFKIDHYPDGQNHLVLLDELDLKTGKIDVISRIRNAEELFILMQLFDILKRQGVRINDLILPYLFCERTDRLFSLSEAIDIDIVCNVLTNSGCNIANIVLYDTHSDKTLSLCENVCRKEIVRSIYTSPYVACFPDEGAHLRYWGHCLEEYIIINKTRTGDKIKVDVKEEHCALVKGRTLVVRDDLCDGGGTFVALAPILREMYQPGKLVLSVTHAIQESGIRRVAELYDEVVITNSYADWNLVNLPENVIVSKLNFYNEES